MKYVKYMLIVLVIVLFLLMVTALFIYAWNSYEKYHARKEIALLYTSQGKSLVAQAIQDLKNHSNDWIICTDLGLSLQNIDDPKVIAAWIAYYQYGNQYCQLWWSPKNSSCETLRKTEKYAKNKLFFEKRVTLCEIAKQEMKMKAK